MEVCFSVPHVNLVGGAQIKGWQRLRITMKKSDGLFTRLPDGDADRMNRHYENSGISAHQNPAAVSFFGYGILL